jgi:hypothetical protein
MGATDLSRCHLQHGRVRRMGVYLRVSTATRTRHGDALTFDQDPAVQKQPLPELSVRTFEPTLLPVQ